jgi:hypothetical protein
MADYGDDLPRGWRELNDGFFVNEFRPEGKDGPDMRFNIPFSQFLVSVKSDSPIGNDWNNDPLDVIRKLDPEGEVFRIPREDVQAMTLRVNAELPANPKYTRSIVSGFPGSTRVVIVHFKDQRDDAEIT